LMSFSGSKIQKSEADYSELIGRGYK
jgi:hypothetical protein